jgi:hypothetical protein
MDEGYHSNEGYRIIGVGGNRGCQKRRRFERGAVAMSWSSSGTGVVGVGRSGGGLT